MRKKEYIKPEIIVIQFRSERGYASSFQGNPIEMQINLMINQEIDEMNYHNNIQDFTDHPSWLINDDESFWQ